MDEEKESVLTGKFLFRLTKDVVALLGLFSLVLFFIYIVGNFQGFQDTTQAIILETLGISAILFGIISLIGVVESIYFFIIKDTLPVWQNIIFLFMMIVCIFLAASFVSISIFLNVLSGGL